VTSHPDNSTRRIGHDGHKIAFASGDFPIHEHVLHLLLAAETEWPEPVARSTAANNQPGA
jgi:hypothetical protein